MPVLPPIRSSATRELKRPQPMPAKLREAVCLMVYGHPDDIDCRALSFIEAAQETRIKPDVMRRYLDRPDVRALLLSERRAFGRRCAEETRALCFVFARRRKTAWPWSPRYVLSKSLRTRGRDQASRSTSV
jgi:hypothetical protein